MKLTVGIAIGLVAGSLWGAYGPVHLLLPQPLYCWSDDYGGDGCGMCPWHECPEETQAREEKERQQKDNGHCGATGQPDPRQDNPGVHV